MHDSTPHKTILRVVEHLKQIVVSFELCFNRNNIRCTRERRSPFYNADNAGTISRVDRSSRIPIHECVPLNSHMTLQRLHIQTMLKAHVIARTSHCSGRPHQRPPPPPPYPPAATSSLCALVPHNPMPMVPTSQPSQKEPLFTHTPQRPPLKYHQHHHHPMNQLGKLKQWAQCFGDIPLEPRARHLVCARK